MIKKPTEFNIDDEAANNNNFRKKLIGKMFPKYELNKTNIIIQY